MRVQEYHNIASCSFGTFQPSAYQSLTFFFSHQFYFVESFDVIRQFFPKLFWKNDEYTIESLDLQNF